MVNFGKTVIIEKDEIYLYIAPLSSIKLYFHPNENEKLHGKFAKPKPPSDGKDKPHVFGQMDDPFSWNFSGTIE